MTEILQRSVPYDPLAEVPLPGIAPQGPEDWLIVDDAYAGQMAERRRLLSERRKKVLALDESARDAAVELLDQVLGVLRSRDGFSVSEQRVVCQDQSVMPIDRADPLGTLGQVVQEDFCLLEKRGTEHVMTGAVLCFPASWMLSEKFMRPLIGIHEPVGEYDDNIARRVQRLFDGVRVGRPLWRKNALWYREPDLFQPRSENARRDTVGAGEGDYLRTERQSILRLPVSDAVVFAIHTFVLARADVNL